MTSLLSSWRRLVTVTAVCFALLFALLAWRVSAGDDPVTAAATGTAVTATATDDAAATATDDWGSTDPATTDDSAAGQPSTPSTQAS